MVLAATAQSKTVRGQATINLMELAGMDDMPEAFDGYARELAHAALGPWYRAHYLLYLGEGMSRLGRLETAQESLKEAISFANANMINQVSFKAQAALAALRKIPPSTKPFVAPPSWVPEEINSVVRAMSDLRKTTVAAA
jgi:hypothetical protein